ncbi:MAG: SDR family oxidoreductase [Spirochaetaceae bacterium]|jgi:all-trans-retinol dehydrogenase (NAD+)|nr:SDR family oxidoreductase [Spirochaetaceae bacterium]
MKRVKNALMVVTGGASGMGRLVSLDFARRGSRVILWDISGAALKKMELDAEAEGIFIKGMVCDVSDREAVYRRAEQVTAEYGTPDILINNAGVVSGQPLLESSDEKIIRSINVNTLALFWTTRAFLPGMIKRDSGHIVTVSSAAGLTGVAGLADYSASKFGAFGFHESVRMELRTMKSRIKTTIVCPYFIDTGMFLGVKTRFPLLLPVIKSEDAANAIVRGIQRNASRVILPRFVKMIFFLRMLPVAVFDAAMDLMGINHAMDHFTGRPRPGAIHGETAFLRKAE